MLEPKDLELIAGIVNTAVKPIEKKLENVENRLENVEVHLENVDTRLRHVEITLENETNRNICFIAEGHQNLDRKLNEAIKLCQDSLSYTEQFQLRQNGFECELSILKDRVTKLEEQKYSGQGQTA